MFQVFTLKFGIYVLFLLKSKIKFKKKNKNYSLMTFQFKLNVRLYELLTFVVAESAMILTFAFDFQIKKN